jgi:hypothetical protein
MDNVNLFARVRCFYARMYAGMDYVSCLCLEDKLVKDEPLSPMEISLLNKVMGSDLIEEEEACLNTLRECGRLPY